MEVHNSNFISEFMMPESICDEIVDLCNISRNKLKLQTGKMHLHYGYKYTQLGNLSPSCKKQYKDHLYLFLKSYISHYNYLENINPNILERNSVQVQVYDKGSFYNTLHCENGHEKGNHHRILVYMTYCNNYEDEGGTEFPYLNYTSKPRKGLTLIWPAYWTHMHIGVPSNNFSKIITTGWFTNRLAKNLREIYDKNAIHLKDFE